MTLKIQKKMNILILGNSSSLFSGQQIIAKINQPLPVSGKIATSQ
jgi:hypothetical protein